MYDLYIVKRTQIYLTEAQLSHLADRAATRGVTTSHVIREAVDEYLMEQPSDQLQLERFRAAVKRVAGSVPRLPDGRTYVAEIRAGEENRREELERRWRS